MIYKISCSKCGKKFDNEDYNALFCSNDCLEEVNKKIESKNRIKIGLKNLQSKKWDKNNRDKINTHNKEKRRKMRIGELKYKLRL